MLPAELPKDGFADQFSMSEISKAHEQHTMISDNAVLSSNFVTFEIKHQIEEKKD